MYFKRRNIVKYFIALLIGISLYCEWFIYTVQPWSWPQLQCENHEECTRILFIADPQIQGDLAVTPPISYIFNWDSDRYLKLTFSVVLKYFKPHVLVYLGDLMDEGSVSTLPQFHSYVKRLFNIFDIDYPVTQIWLPGDNDIGGENEPIKNEKIDEFEKVFEQPHMISYRNITFYKVSGITHTYPKSERSNNNFKVAVSHYPITLRQAFAKEVIESIDPNIFFCAHDHESKYVKQHKDLTNREKHLFENGNGILNIAPNNKTLYEIYVPTCSYRMGTNKIGYGAAILDGSNNNLKYTVFWSPTRFPYLIVYAAVLIFFLAYLILFCVARLIHSKPIKFNMDKQPLLERI